MSAMFYSAWAFNQPLGMDFRLNRSGWDTSAVENMSYMFAGAVNFNSAISHWNTSAVKDMSYMFSSARAFNQAINNWDTSSVKSMAYMFFDAMRFDQALAKWNTSKLENVSSMFHLSINFNKPIGSWDTSRVRDMRPGLSRQKVVGDVCFHGLNMRNTFQKKSSFDGVGKVEENTCGIFSGGVVLFEMNPKRSLREKGWLKTNFWICGHNTSSAVYFLQSTKTPFEKHWRDL